MNSGDTTIDLPGSDGATRDGRMLGPAALLLAHTGDGRRSFELRELREAALVLDRDAALFPGGPLGDGAISRGHAELVADGGRWRLDDRGSRNGCFVNGERVVGSRFLQPGDVLRLGRTILVYAPSPGRAALDPVDSPLVGIGLATQRVRGRIAAAAPHELTALVTGETGTGKDLVARALHDQSGRPGRFVAVNCGAVAPSILESELFGHARGAFTGAVEAREGLFRAAHRGTLLLDEVGDMPREMQVGLLRVLESRAVRPLGTARDVAVDVRVIAATNADLVGAVADGRFRADLYARLAQWPIHVPPLRERREDLPALVGHLLSRLGAAGRPLELPLAEAVLLHPWPLNVRGLLSVLSVAVAACPGNGPLARTDEVEAALAAQRVAPGSTGPPARSEPPPFAPPMLPDPDELKTLFHRYRGNLAAVARALGCSRQQLYRRLEQQGLTVADLREP